MDNVPQGLIPGYSAPQRHNNNINEHCLVSFDYLPQALIHFTCILLNPLGANFKKWLNTLTQFVGKLLSECV